MDGASITQSSLQEQPDFDASGWQLCPEPAIERLQLRSSSSLPNDQLAKRPQGHSEEVMRLRDTFLSALAERFLCRPADQNRMSHASPRLDQLSSVKTAMAG